MFGSSKFEKKYKRKNREENRKKKLKSINYFYKILQTHLIYFNF